VRPAHSSGFLGESLDWLQEDGIWLIRKVKSLSAKAPPDFTGPSGVKWISQYPTSTSLDDLAEPFRGNVNRFIASLRHLMHFAFAIAREKEDPRRVPAMRNVDIQWVHQNAHGEPDLAASKVAAQEMVEGYDIEFKPVLGSRHTEGNAIDMTITWNNDLVIVNGSGAKVTISSLPRNGAGNTDLHHVGMSHGVIKLSSDPPHWSSDGH
jgi:hypothetical protein